MTSHHSAFHLPHRLEFLRDSTIEKRASKFDVTEFVAYTALGIAVLDYVIAPSGQSLVSKLIATVFPSAKQALPLPPPPPLPVPPPVAVHPLALAPAMPAVVPVPPVPMSPAAVAAVKGYYAGANNQAGFLRGMSPYGGYDLGDRWHGHGGWDNSWDNHRYSWG